jgi:hypothetical protein
MFTQSLNSEMLEFIYFNSIYCHSTSLAIMVNKFN